MLRGVIVRAFNSYYFVQTANKVAMCTLRGRFKKERFSLLVGDEVEYTATGEEKGVIEQILPRRSMLRRPMVANVDQVILTFAAVNPDINTALVDRFLILAELSGLEIVICINKVDLADTNQLQALAGLYQRIGYPVLLLSAKQNTGLEPLKQRLFGRISVFAGPSGAGKSTILNALEPGLALTTGEVSAKIGRGKHTTRFAELLPLSGGGFVVDTPGFSFTEFTDVAAPELMHCFPEFAKFAGNCKFTTCLHHKEPQCAVKQAVQEGQIAPKRYDSYLEVLTEIREARKGF
ncbi:ribosome small subunit-dependent GTPase A|uniref:Small ribosomal subunit biogenesis GTPase RsgA n=1 Tax=Dendrosporobacter quercicolus TaxID=146817 RepID=A0A1G9M301_9FIRM|nr:ribosome small subunit-dependent GTPase A [Dendrosporobacter quercicolus]NSL46897.1 ribosome small subunit-dependent GTPase A [Dendrosporobacter quercicolus DSM 1736]SDL68578.1 ribosome biogenesis GTPase [Dendrosporobacter quercicolus]